MYLRLTIQQKTVNKPLRSRWVPSHRDIAKAKTKEERTEIKRNDEVIPHDRMFRHIDKICLEFVANCGTPCANGLTGLCFFVVPRGHGQPPTELIDNVKHHVLVMCHVLPEVGSISWWQFAIEDTGNSKARDMGASLPGMRYRTIPLRIQPTCPMTSSMPSGRREPFLDSVSAACARWCHAWCYIRDISQHHGPMARHIHPTAHFPRAILPKSSGGFL